MTPQDYLEKVFQVPFNLQPMEKTGFEALVKHLLPIAQTTVNIGTTEQTGVSTIPEKDSIPNTSPSIPSQPIDLTTGAMQYPNRYPSKPDQPKSHPPDPQRLALTQKKIADVQRFQPLFQTPRAVKRLANTYCLIRVGVEEADWSDYLGLHETPGMYRVPMLLLAVSSAFPTLARPWLLWLLETSPEQWKFGKGDPALLAAKHADTTQSADWDRLARCLDQLTLQEWEKPTPAGSSCANKRGRFESSRMTNCSWSRSSKSRSTPFGNAA